MTNGKAIAGGLVALLAVILIAVFALKPQEPKVTATESGPVVVEEKVPTDLQEKAAFDLRKAASACRVAILQSAKNPETVEFAHELDKTPSVVEANGDYSFKIGLKARNQSKLVSRQVSCTAHKEESGWSIAALKELG